MRILAAALLAVSLGTVAAEPSPAMQALDRELGAIASDPQKPLAGLSVVAIRDGRVVYERQFGFRHIDNADTAKNIPANSSTLYRVASITKLVTALGVMRLVEQHQIGRAHV